ncbi:tRNA pseudouridine(38-40) synthase TruA [Thalassotalea agarivorans]|uniref:tRNA pseudouridine synthase A n=1 Tax=Thalassotalea agarivorans TaxID=349064 RepID=A0A1H9ZNA8_THASX|nr:tRNA pseudouridine(38-40) synthase TruA [Thalassotalea agarivorans]SES83046.1 tRNA pseudouridine38-40 synthase [Thalassotalea agarivorans]
MRYAIGVEYNGENYFGWQRQRDVVSVQQRLEEALSHIANEPIEVVCAGRTDTGVNATNQIVHFDCNKPRKHVAWTQGTNSKLPKDIAVKWVTEVDESFHARFSATARRYRYIIYNGPLRPAIMANGLSFCHYPLDETLMHQAAQVLVGENNFDSFRTVHCQANSPIRTVKHCNVSRQGDFVIIDIKANAFLHHMVRNIAGSLMKVGKKERPIEWIAQVLAAQDRTVAGMTAPSGGLYFVDVDYPEQYALPTYSLGPLFIPE